LRQAGSKARRKEEEKMGLSDRYRTPLRYLQFDKMLRLKYMRDRRYAWLVGKGP
jgi:hypothetical protein